MYVACTRAKDTLDLFSPLSIYSRSSGDREPASPSPFIRELPPDLMEEIYENYGGVLAKRKVQSAPSVADFGASLKRRRHTGDDEDAQTMRRRRNDDWPPVEREDGFTPRSREDADDAYMAAVREAARSGSTLEESPEAKTEKRKLGFCRHRLFGRGKIVEEIPPDKYRVHFPGFGLKIILADYLTLEQP